MKNLPHRSSSTSSSNGKVYQVNVLQDVKSNANYEVWTDLKSRSRNKAKDAAKDMRRTGNPPVDKKLMLTPQDTKILSTLGSQSCLGHQGIPDSMENAQVVFDGERLVVYADAAVDESCVDMEDGPSTEEGNKENLPLDDNIPRAELLQPVRRRLSESSSSSSRPPSPRSASPFAARAAASTTTAGTAAAPAGPSASILAPSSKATPTPLPFDRRKGTSAASKAREHFSRTREQRERRVALAIETRDKFAEMQELQLKNQELMAKTLMKLAETDAARLHLDEARLEQDKVTSNALLAMAEAIKGLTHVLDIRRS